MNSMIRIVLLLAFCSTHSAHERFWYPYHDGTSRVVRLTADTLQSTLQNKNVVVVHYELANDQNEKGKSDAINRMLETTAQVLENNQVVVGVYNLADGAPAEGGLQQPGSIKVYRQGKPFVFHGYHLPETLLSFISKVNSTAVTQIANKQDKKLFESYEGTKVIGFFQQESGAYKFYEQAAEFLHPNVPFFVVFDQLIANSLRCKGTGIIELVLPFRKDRVQCPQIPATTEEIVNFVQENRSTPLLKITKENVHSLWGERENSVVAFYSSSSPVGRSFFKVLKGRARYCNATAIPMLAIDTDQFPMLLDVWQSLLKIDLSQPHLGYINSKTYEAAWMDISTFQTLTPIDQSRAVQQWMQDIDDGLVTNDGTAAATIVEERAPLSCQERVEKVKKSEKEVKKEEEVQNAQPVEVEEEKTSETEVKEVADKNEKKPVEEMGKKKVKSQTNEKTEKKQTEKSEKVKKPKVEEKNNNPKEEQKRKVEKKKEEKPETKEKEKTEEKPETEEKNNNEKEEEKKKKKNEKPRKPKKENNEQKREGKEKERGEKKVEKEKFNKNKKNYKNKNEGHKEEREVEEKQDKKYERKNKKQNKEKRNKDEKQQKNKHKK